ncbi:MAG: restriction endonuclease subunit R [Ignavibacteria bacterium]|jgi:hypothetical protein|nr:restriction endonuclease subunit R [Ignavibacteria bacterium]MCU7522287.1 restriction endonuclease subunit R [Ignavibacteria bacterium]
MAPIPTKVSDRLIAGVKKFQPILAAAKSRDINESDTVLILTDMLAEIFGYDKYSEITSEFAIRGTYCDLATRVNGKILFLVEAKAIGADLKEAFIKQAVDYAANLGVDWVILTNGVFWRVYKISFTKPIEHEVILEFDFLSLNMKNAEHIDYLWLLSREGWLKSLLEEFHEQKQVLSRFSIGALIISDSILDTIRKELKKISPDIKIEKDQIKKVLTQEIIKRDVLEGDKAQEAVKNINRAMSRIVKAKEKLKSSSLKPIPSDAAQTTEEAIPLEAN